MLQAPQRRKLLRKLLRQGRALKTVATEVAHATAVATLGVARADNLAKRFSGDGEGAADADAALAVAETVMTDAANSIPAMSSNIVEALERAGER